METPRKSIIAKLSNREFESSSMLEDPSSQIESFAIIDLCGVSTKLNYMVLYSPRKRTRNLLRFIITIGIREKF